MKISWNKSDDSVAGIAKLDAIIANRIFKTRFSGTIGGTTELAGLELFKNSMENCENVNQLCATMQIIAVDVEQNKIATN